MSCKTIKTNTPGCGLQKGKCSDEKSIEGLVKCYKKNYRKNLQSQFDFYKSLSSLDEAIEKASQCIYSKDNKKHPHQYRLRNNSTPSTLDEVKKSLSEMETKTKLESMSTFDELFHFLEDKIGKIDGIGPLMIYDTALRLGAKLGLKPEKVYLHAGTRSGAKALGLDCKNKIIEIEKFPEPIQQLEPYEIEDFLCIYKDDLKSIK